MFVTLLENVPNKVFVFRLRVLETSENFLTAKIEMIAPSLADVVRYEIEQQFLKNRARCSEPASAKSC
jgi:hypothetical protein